MPTSCGLQSMDYLQGSFLIGTKSSIASQGSDSGG